VPYSFRYSAASGVRHLSMPPLSFFDCADAFPCDGAGCVSVVNEIGIEARVHASRSELWPLVPDPLIGFALIAPPFTETAVGVWHWAHCVHDGRDDDGLPELGALYVVDVFGGHGGDGRPAFSAGEDGKFTATHRTKWIKLNYTYYRYPYRDCLCTGGRVCIVFNKKILSNNSSTTSRPLFHWVSRRWTFFVIG